SRPARRRHPHPRPRPRPPRRPRRPRPETTTEAAATAAVVGRATVETATGPAAPAPARERAPRPWVWPGSACSAPAGSDGRFTVGPAGGYPRQVAVPSAPRRSGTVAVRWTQNPPATEIPWPTSPQEVGHHMRQYELMLILDPEIEERTVAPSLDKYLSVVSTAGGSVDKVDIWGKRRLSYDIDKRSEGIYAVVDITTT